jgi:3-oxoacyl-[acyl-carrier-protein] synthase-3
MDKIGIVGFGFYIPEKRVLIKELAEKSGMHSKAVEYIGAESVSEASEEELPSTMGIEAAKKAIEDASISPKEIDIIINAPAGLQDYTIPPISGKIQHAIGAENAICFDIVQGCCGMLTSLELAKNYILSQNYNTVLIVSSDKWSAYTPYHTAEAVIFGDGAGAIVVQNNAKRFFVRDFIFKTSGAYYDLYGIENCGVKNLNSKEIVYKCLNPERARKEFKDLYMSSFVEISKKLMNKNRLKPYSIAYLSMVNANLKLLEVVASNLDIPLEKTSKDLLIKYGHIGGFDIFFNIYKAAAQSKIKKGEKIILLNAGIGFTWGSALLEY